MRHQARIQAYPTDVCVRRSWLQCQTCNFVRISSPPLCARTHAYPTTSTQPWQQCWPSLTALCSRQPPMTAMSATCPSRYHPAAPAAKFSIQSTVNNRQSTDAILPSHKLRGHDVYKRDTRRLLACLCPAEPQLGHPVTNSGTMTAGGVAPPDDPPAAPEKEVPSATTGAHTPLPSVEDRPPMPPAPPPVPPKPPPAGE